ncbi:MAG: DUF4335 domain-containing protein [Cyanomargarita calcarea GSE-NOS-MK-12-04C]|jgi:hypothetical protein|uniref:DUF4335 domain-containing protein n=1 Tax=Cyanomargarita calcarea GSE-NOS-MK-12-04C TaxID=2839659 RepID=A0A951UVH3_9CYAN|nr:DUF4335 domain-containing protein [Cyanomargarita calcarea GSE-NOS-MK-12-04C]
MNIQRKYSLPNCTLLLEGLSDASRTAHFQELRPELSILVNAECYFTGYNQPLTGGRDFFESLVRAVSAYAQEFLSNVPNPQAHNQDSELVQLQKIGTNRHRLIVNSEASQQGLEANSNYAKSPIELDLNTVQLFDLVEAVDQFFADSQTIPELSLELQPVARRYGGTSQALMKQAVPAGVGVSSLALSAIAFGLIPVPQVRQPQENLQSKAVTQNRIANTSTPTASATPIANEQPAINTTTPTPTPVTPLGAVKDLEALLTTVPEITDPSQLRALNRQVYNTINPAWTSRTGLNQESIFRVGVAADGSIVGYKAVNKGSNDTVEKTPLPNLLYNPANRSPIASEPIAQFRVVFNPQGELQVSPWRGYTKTPDVVGAKISDPNTVKDLNQKLSDSLRQSWSGNISSKKELKYRVAVNKDGALADYEPLNQSAYDSFRETPLPNMFIATHGGSNVAAASTKEPLAHFQVVFTPDGKLEVAPWQGYR